MHAADSGLHSTRKQYIKGPVNVQQEVFHEPADMSRTLKSAAATVPPAMWLEKDQKVQNPSVLSCNSVC